MTQEQSDPDFSCLDLCAAAAGARDPHAQKLASTLARHTLGWIGHLPGQWMIAQTTAWYHAWARNSAMQTVALRQITDYEALS